MIDHDVTSNEIMDFLQEHMVTREEFSQLDAKVDGLDIKINQTKLDLLDAMDTKLANLKGDLVVLMRTEDQKVNALIHLLAKRKVISDQEAIVLAETRPFPQSVA